LVVTDTQWLISAQGTVTEISAKIGVYDPNTPTAQWIGNAIIFATSAYSGRAPTSVWDWIKSKLEAQPRG
jgi:hypothetical protein